MRISSTSFVKFPRILLTFRSSSWTYSFVWSLSLPLCLLALLLYHLVIVDFFCSLFSFCFLRYRLPLIVDVFYSWQICFVRRSYIFRFFIFVRLFTSLISLYCLFYYSVTVSIFVDRKETISVETFPFDFNIVQFHADWLKRSCIMGVKFTKWVNVIFNSVVWKESSLAH